MSREFPKLIPMNLNTYCCTSAARLSLNIEFSCLFYWIIRRYLRTPVKYWVSTSREVSLESPPTSALTILTRSGARGSTSLKQPCWNTRPHFLIRFSQNWHAFGEGWELICVALPGKFLSLPRKIDYTVAVRYEFTSELEMHRFSRSVEHVVSVLPSSCTDLLDCA